MHVLAVWGECKADGQFLGGMGLGLVLLLDLRWRVAGSQRITKR